MEGLVRNIQKEGHVQHSDDVHVVAPTSSTQCSQVTVTTILYDIDTACNNKNFKERLKNLYEGRDIGRVIECLSMGVQGWEHGNGGGMERR